MKHSLKDILKSLKVLLVLKRESVLDVEIKILEMFFHKIIFSTSAEKAMDILSKDHPDVIITDIELANKNGIDLCKSIRKINPSIPIIILSQNTDKEYLFEIIRLHVIDFVPRPTKAEKLIFALNQTAKHILNHGNINIKLHNGNIYNYKEKTILKKDGKVSKLTKNEFRLLELLLANKQHLLKKKEIENYLWANEDVTESAFKSLFSRLRQKIGKENVKNSFGIGYQLL